MGEMTMAPVMSEAWVMHTNVSSFAHHFLEPALSKILMFSIEKWWVKEIAYISSAIYTSIYTYILICQ